MLMILKNVFSKVIVLYVVAGALIFFCVKKERANLYRVDILSGASLYPMEVALGKKPSNESQWRMAVRFYKLLGDAYNTQGRAEEMRGYCYFKMNNLRLSQVYYERALRESPSRVWLTYNLGVLAYRVGNIEAATKYFNAVVSGGFEDQVKYAILSNLKGLDEAKRNEMFFSVGQFAYMLRQRSGMCLQAIYINQVIDNPQMLQLELHPWSFILSPGKESVYN